MKLLDSLLDAIVRLEGDALVMHVGEKPYVITTSAAMNAYRGPLAWGQVELSSRVLTFDAVSSMLAQILPLDQQRALDELGAIEHEILPPDGILDRFTVVAARGGEDVWVEVRRKPTMPAVVEAPGPAATVIEQSTVYAPEAPPVAEPAIHVEATPEAAALVARPEEQQAPLAATPQEISAPPQAHAAPPAQAEPQEQPEPEQEEDDAIVVALPGEDYQEVELDRVPDNAIQIIEDEAQDVPTEEEVDAMLAATASALLNSGLAVDADTFIDADARIQPAAEIEGSPESIEIALTQELVESEFEQDGVELSLTPQAPMSEPEQAPDAYEIAAPEAMPELAVPEAAMPEFAAADNVPEFALSPPPAVAPEEPAVESAETPVDVPQGAPLFSEEAVAAAAPPEQPVAIEPIAVAAVEQPAEPVALEPEPVAAIVPEPVAAIVPEPVAASVPEPQPVDVAPVPPAVVEVPAPATLVAEDLAAHAAVWSNALTEWATPPSAPEAPPSSLDQPAQIPEMPMDVTPEPRHEEVVASHQHAAAASTQQYEARSQHDAASDEARSAVVVPLARTPIKQEPIVVPYTPAEDAALMRTLRLAAARGAATVYVVAQSKPMLRVDGEITPLESEPVLTAADVDRLVMELAPPRRRDALQNGPVEWLCDIPEVGRVRCLTFRDHRGPGVLFRMFPPRAISADQLALTPEVQALCQQSDGLVLVTGARASGKSTLLNAFVDLINRTRGDHVITIESQIGFVHESRKSFISQRETRGDGDLAASLTRAALREDPDVMMIEELKSAELVSAALEAAESGRLVLASVPGASTIAALERVIELLPADRRAKGRASLATSLRGVLAQVLLRRVTGGRIAAREILLNTPAVSTLILEGKMFQLPVALDSGRRHGMVPLTDSLAHCVREGTVNPGEAYRKALDRAALVAALKRDGVDTSFAERLA